MLECGEETESKFHFKGCLTHRFPISPFLKMSDEWQAISELHCQFLAKTWRWQVIDESPPPMVSASGPETLGRWLIV